MTPGIKQAYFDWLCDRVNINYGRPGKTYHHVLEILHNKEFVWVVPNDDNRLEDAVDVRREFLSDSTEDPIDVPLSVLEVIIGLSERLAFLDGTGKRDWAWRLMENLGLHKYTDSVAARYEDEIEDILEKLIWRLYEPDGSGGFFPLAFPQENQTKEEIWHQMNAYLAEQLER